MDKIFKLFGDVDHAKIGGGDSFGDRLSSKYTVCGLALVAILSTTRVFVDEPISCYCPSEFTSSQVAFTNKVCWTHNTHFVSYDQKDVPLKHEPKQYISYYQWIPLFLAFQALLFYLPRPIWRVLSRKSGIRVSDMTDAAIEFRRKSTSDKSDKIMNYMVKQMNQFLSDFTRQKRASLSKISTIWVYVYGNYLVMAYVLIKLLYLGNVIGQLFLLNKFLSFDYHLFGFYGFEVINRMASGGNWTTSHRFPRITVCDLYVREMGNLHRKTVQCALPLNLFYEIIFLFLWFWFVFVAAATVCSLLIWIVTSLHQPLQVDYALARLVGQEKVHQAQRARVSKFVTSYLRRDGCFIIRMVAKNSSDLIAAELLAGVWEHFVQISKSSESMNSKSDQKMIDT